MKKRFLNFFKKKSKTPRLEKPYSIDKYREFDKYQLTKEVYQEKTVFISSKLPSEPPEGIEYQFGPTGYVGNSKSNYCVIPTTWKNVNNYCHWNFTELPFLFLLFESSVQNIVIPDKIIDCKLPFQQRWLEILRNNHPEKNIFRLSKINPPANSLIPINHDTSTNTKLIGKCQYKFYHHGRATPYLIDRIENVYQGLFDSYDNSKIGSEYIYINRSSRRLKNEKKIQSFLQNLNFKIINLEDFTLDEQVYIFSKAKVIIGFHGSGLSNLLFSNPNVHVVEIVDQDCVYPCYIDGVVIPGRKATRTYYHMLAEMKGLHYNALESNNYVLNIDVLKNELDTTFEQITTRQ